MIWIRSGQHWHDTFPAACIGILEVSGIDQSHGAAILKTVKPPVEARLRKQYAGFQRRDFMAMEIIQAYDRFYNRFDKTYHILLQLESLVLKGKDLPEVVPLVDANFMAEMETLVLTAGHDADLLHPPLAIDVTDGTEDFTQLSGKSRTLRAGDMCMTDAGGVVCTIIYGQDQRTPISLATTHALYISYAPAGVGTERVNRHLEKVRDTIFLFSPDAMVEQLTCLTA